MSKIVNFRRARAEDVPAIVDLAVESVSRDALPVTIDKAAMASKAAYLIGQPQHFIWVGEADGQVVSAVAAETYPGFWFKRDQCSVLLFYGRLPGSVMPLLRQFARWVKGRPIVKLAIFELEPTADPALERFLQRLGFNRKSTNLTYVRSPA